MFTILEKQPLADRVFSMRIEAPLIAGARKPGQFIILQVDEDLGERIPLTIADADTEAGWIRIIFQVVGATTRRLAAMEAGDALPVLLGPLGHPTDIRKVGTVVCVGGGIGAAPLYPIVKGFKEAGNHVVVVLGARTDGLLILEEEMRAVADELIVCTDDGSAGRKALVTEPLEALCDADPKPGLTVAIGPPLMMKCCSETTRPYAVKTLVSLNTLMVDGTGMCGGCRVTVGGEVKFTCVDGPEFDGHLVDFDNFIQRQQAYQEKEQRDRSRCRVRG